MRDGGQQWPPFTFDKVLSLNTGTRTVTLLELLTGAAVARLVRFHFRSVTDERCVAGGFGTGDFGTGHGTGERPTGGLPTGTLLFEPFEPFAFFLLVLRYDVKVE